MESGFENNKRLCIIAEPLVSLLDTDLNDRAFLVFSFEHRIDGFLHLFQRDDFRAGVEVWQFPVGRQFLPECCSFLNRVPR